MHGGRKMKHMMKLSSIAAFFGLLTGIGQQNLVASEGLRTSVNGSRELQRTNRVCSWRAERWIKTIQRILPTSGKDEPEDPAGNSFERCFKAALCNPNEVDFKIWPYFFLLMDAFQDIVRTCSLTDLECFEGAFDSSMSTVRSMTPIVVEGSGFNEWVASVVECSLLVENDAMMSLIIRLSSSLQLSLLRQPKSNAPAQSLLTLLYSIDVTIYNILGAKTFLKQRSDLLGPNFASLGRLVVGEYDEVARLISSPQLRSHFLGRFRMDPGHLPPDFLLFLSDEEAGGTNMHQILHEFVWNNIIIPAQGRQSDTKLNSYINELVHMTKDFHISPEEGAVQPHVERMVIQYLMYSLFEISLTEEHTNMLQSLFFAADPTTNYVLMASEPYSVPDFLNKSGQRKISEMQKLIKSSPALSGYVPSAFNGKLSKEEYSYILIPVVGIAGFLGAANLGTYILSDIPKENLALLNTHEAIMQAVLETARRNPPVNNVNIIADAPSEFDVDGRTIEFPAGTVVAACIGMANLDESTFPDPHSFNPGRHNLVSSTLSFNTLGFSAEQNGRRACLGRNIAVTMGSKLIDAIRKAADLTLPQNDPDAASRQEAIDQVASAIKNDVRTHTVKGGSFVLGPGPIFEEGNLANKILLQDTANFYANENPNIARFLAIGQRARISSLDDYDEMYQTLSTFIDEPLSRDISDEAFAQDRLTIKASRLRLVVDSSIDLGMREDQIFATCGELSVTTLQQKNKLFMEDLSFVGDFNDPDQPQTYAPSAVGYFCLTSQQKFVPLAIHLVDTNLTYYPSDADEEWLLAKMALNAASNNVHQFDHFVQTHLMLEPIRIELIRNVSPKHPLYNLLEHHFLQLFANTVRGLLDLVDEGTVFDTMSGWGATGSLRFIEQELKVASFQNFEDRMEQDGLNHLPDFKFRDDSRKVSVALHKFVWTHLDAYYMCSDGKAGPTSNKNIAMPMNNELCENVQLDTEVQRWASEACSFFGDFPCQFDNLQDLVNTVTDLIFRVSVQHHALNSDAVWHQVSYPYSLLALNHPLPTSKGALIDLMDYIIPSQVGWMLVLAARFKRPIRLEVTILKSYNDLDLGIRSYQAVTDYQLELAAIDGIIDVRERNSTRPFTLMKPSRLPHFVWI